MQRLLRYWRLARFHTPAGTLLLLWPTLWALWAAAGGFPGWKWLALFVGGVVVMRAFGCVVNDIADIKLDKEVTRTRTRPLAAGEVSVAEALGLAGFFLLLAFVLFILLPPLARWWCLPALALALVYPFSKRVLAMPQAVLALAFSAGMPVADVAVRGEMPSLAVWLLLGGNVLWIVAYDTIYAMADKADDAAYGKIGSSALLFGRRDVAAVSVLYVLCVLWLSAAGIVLNYGIAYQVALLACMGAVFKFWQQYRTRHPQACMAAFRANHWFGLFVFAGVAAAHHQPV